MNKVYPKGSSLTKKMTSARKRIIAKENGIIAIRQRIIAKMANIIADERIHESQKAHRSKGKWAFLSKSHTQLLEIPRATKVPHSAAISFFRTRFGFNTV